MQLRVPAPCGDNGDELFAVQLEAHGRRVDTRATEKLPDRLPRARDIRTEPAVALSDKHEPSRRDECAAPQRFGSSLPSDLAVRRPDGRNRSVRRFSRDGLLIAADPELAFPRCGVFPGQRKREMQPEHIEKARPRGVRRGWPVRAAPRSGRNHHPFERRYNEQVLLRHERFGPPDERPGDGVEDIHPARLAGNQEDLVVPVLRDDRWVREVVIPYVVRNCLKVPLQLAGRGVEGDDGRRVEVVAGAAPTIVARRGIAHRHVEQP